MLADAAGEVVFRNRTAAGLRRRPPRRGAGRLGHHRAASPPRSQGESDEPHPRPVRPAPPVAAAARRAASASPTATDAGAVLGAFLVVEDVSERQRLEAVRRDFVANISHELKTPVGALGLLAETLAGEDDPEVVAAAWPSACSARRSGWPSTIDDLLQLSQIEASEPPVREPVPVGTCARRGRRPHPARGRAPLGRAAWSSEPALADRAGRPPPAGLGGRQPVRQRREVLRRRRRVVRLARPRPTAGWVEIDVADQGIGIPARDLERVFERFYRVDRARSRDTGGTGLGLAIVRHVVQNHEGEVTVSSREGEGSTFTLRLPAGPGPRRHATPPQAAA